MKRVTLQFYFEDEDLAKFIKDNGDISNWAFGEICQNLDFGFLVMCTIEDSL